jgi:pimeloyl-ACP methyl ester carboxylesterase
MAGWIVIGLILMLVLLRAIVYFRDTYRATNYGVPDLVQIIRAIDGRLGEHHPHIKDKRVELSFIGHSMGGLVVTNALRTLSDVFKVRIESLNHFGAAGPKPSEEIQRIGETFVLKRLVLASPDIPAEALLSDRGNFLASVLSRFEEAYLFSNEGDEVLRLISTLANYFTFPTKSADHGFRLGNTEILSEGYGLIRSRAEDFLTKLRVGNLSLQQLYNRLALADAGRRGMRNPTRKETHLPKVFTYFDCTDYFDEDDSGVPRALLSRAKCYKRTDPEAKMPFVEHLRVLRAYLITPKDGHKVNCHGGYFEGKLSQQLIYRLACLGYQGTVVAFGSQAKIGEACNAKQIRVLLSPALRDTGVGPAMAKLHS